ncbi:MAG: sigma-70 family RNA polymerase sigma factor [Chloroflexi bacterium]|nr:MAG: sigma-70 family RNA polymerase sigma factor [Chloroflexota bacterium]
MDDVALLNRARTGDVSAFEGLLAPLVEPGCQLAYAILGDWQEAEDAAQEGALKAWRAIGRLRDDTSSLRPWYLTIVANEARSRRRGRWWSVLKLSEPAATTSVLGPEEAASLRADLDAAMRRLTETERLILVLHFYLDLPLDEVGRVVGLSAQAAKSRLYRATRSLRPAMRQQEPA